ncbi:hypothetical protein JX266_000880 [Neoarthrinium moseri]|nr:hypothetical protein JX266_000880 [Neoarthrinium moseri]
MSFELVTSYKRSLLRPLVVPAGDLLQDSTNLYQDPQSFQSQSWRASTHIFSGTDDRDESTAWPPTNFRDDPARIPNNEAHDIPYDASSLKARNERNFKLYADQAKNSEASKVPPPRLVAKRYLPTDQANDSEQGITLLILTGMGAPKEARTTALKLLERAVTDFQVEEAWAVDMPLSGETAKVNPIGYLYANEKDVARDLLLFITAYLPVCPGQTLPQHLEARRPTSQPRQTTRQNLHVVAHSLGAQSAILASVHAPKIFSSLTVIDPAMIPAGKINDAMAKLPKETLCLGLSERYPDRASVEKELRANKRTRGWDERVVRIFAQHGVMPDRSGRGFQLVARPRLEWALYYDKQTPAECYDRLTDISVPLHAIMPARPFAVPPKMFEADVRKMKQQTEVRWLQGTTHQIVYEKIDACTMFVADWLIKLTGEKRARL